MEIEKVEITQEKEQQLNEIIQLNKEYAKKNNISSNELRCQLMFVITETIAEDSILNHESIRHNLQEFKDFTNEVFSKNIERFNDNVQLN